MRRELNFAKGVITHDGIGVMPTDTLYGLVGSAFSPVAVERIYDVRKRDKTKPLIVLLSSIEDLSQFNIVLDSKKIELLERVWPGPITVILPCAGTKFSYLHRGTNTIAFRVPSPLWLRRFLKKVGPIVAPSANPEGKPPAMTAREAKEYFKQEIDFYVEQDTPSAEASTIIEIKR